MREQFHYLEPRTAANQRIQIASLETFCHWVSLNQHQQLVKIPQPKFSWRNSNLRFLEQFFLDPYLDEIIDGAKVHPSSFFKLSLCETVRGT